MTEDSSAKWRSRRRLALVLLAALLLVGSCSYLTSRSNGSRRGTSPEARVPAGSGTVTVRAGNGHTSNAGATGNTLGAGGHSGTPEGSPAGIQSGGTDTSGGAGSPASAPASSEGGGPTGRGSATPTGGGSSVPGTGRGTGGGSSSPGTGGGTSTTPGGGTSTTPGGGTSTTPGGGTSTTPSGGTSTTPSPSPPGPSTGVSISGDVKGPLYPGGSPQPLDLSLTNSTGQDVSITGLTVSLASITLSADPPAPGTCSSADFQISQFSGSLPFMLAAGETTTLSQLGFSTSEMPQIGMIDQPYDQDGCEGAQLNLSYGGTAS